MKPIPTHSRTKPKSNSLPDVVLTSSLQTNNTQVPLLSQSQLNSTPEPNGPKKSTPSDQQQCGSCRAFGATEAFSDRFSIKLGDNINVVLSPEDLISYDTNDYGYYGGYMGMAWEYLQDHGALSDSCFPYQAGSG
jgi:Papain family cysteine protease